MNDLILKIKYIKNCIKNCKKNKLKKKHQKNSKNRNQKFTKITKTINNLLF